MSLLDQFRAIVASDYPSLAGSLNASLEAGGARAEALAQRILGLYTQLTQGDVAPLARDYATMVLSFNRLQVKYELTGAYPQKTYGEVRQAVYDDLPGMTAYMFGLVCSQFAWSHHFALWRFFEDEFVAKLSAPASVLEVAPGHGLLGLTLCQRYPSARLTGIDISPASVAMSRHIAQLAGVGNARYEQGDALALGDEQFGTLICGEVLEHLTEPGRLLTNLRRALKPGGRGYVTAAITAAAPDHVYEFTSPEEVLEMVVDAGFTVLNQHCAETRPATPKAKGPPRTLAMILT